MWDPIGLSDRIRGRDALLMESVALTTDIEIIV